MMFQPKAWCDESVMKVWVEHEWGNVFTNPPRSGSSGKTFVADVHRAQQTNKVKNLLQIKKALLINVPPGCTSGVQPSAQSIFTFGNAQNNTLTSQHGGFEFLRGDFSRIF